MATAAELLLGTATNGGVWEYATRTLTSGTSAFATPLSYKAVTNNQAATDPGAGKIKWNNSTQNAATQIYLDVITDDGIDLTNYMRNLVAGSSLYLQDRDDAGKYQRWMINLATDNTGWITLNVTLVNSLGGNLANNAQTILVYSLPQTGAEAPTAEENADAVRVELAPELAYLDVAVSTRLPTSGYTAPANAPVPSAADNAAATIAALIEGGLTLQDVLRIVLAVTSGDATGLEGSSMAFKSVDGTKDRVLATYTAGARNVTTLDPT